MDNYSEDQKILADGEEAEDAPPVVEEVGPPATDPALLGAAYPLPDLIKARLTITFGGGRVGDIVMADPLSEKVVQAFEAGWLVKVED